MNKIESLTQDQIDLLPAQAQKWINYGLDTSPLVLSDIKKACAKVYGAANMEAPKFYLFASGPKEAMQFITVAPKINLTKEDFERISQEGDMALTDAIRAEIKENCLDGIKYVRAGMYGQHDAGFISYYDFFLQEFGIGKEMEGLIELTKSAGWVWCFEDLVIVSEKPVTLTMNGQNQLHNEKKPALEYRDGTKLYCFNGVSLPEKWVLERETMDPTEILECEDTDKRAAGIALYGYDRLKCQLDYKVIEGDPTTDIGALVQISIPGLMHPGRFLEAVCPRNGPVFLGVPYNNPWDDDRPINTAVGAQAFLAGFPESAYQHPPIRT